MSLEPGDDKITSLYKYKTITPNTLDMIENNRIFFSYPSEFNDPFDSYVNAVFRGTPQEFENWIQSLTATNQQKGMVRNLLQSNSYDGSVFIGQEPKNDTKDIVILCLAEDPDNIVLWHNYANNHKGICIGFKTVIEGNSLGFYFDDPALSITFPAVTRGFLPTAKVKYNQTMPKEYNRILDDISVLTEFLITKNIKWSYEDERRIILPIKYSGKQLLTFKKESLGTIIFGMNIDKNEKKTIIDIVNKNYTSKGFNVDLYDCKMRHDTYRIELIKI